MSPRITFLKFAAGIVIALAIPVQYPAAASSDIDRQRDLFRQVYADVERGTWEAVDALSARDRELLQEYVLWPDLRAAWFRATIKSTDSSDIEAFLDRHGTLKPARELRYSYSLYLARSGQLDRFLRIYRAY